MKDTLKTIELEDYEVESLIIIKLLETIAKKKNNFFIISKNIFLQIVNLEKLKPLNDSGIYIWEGWDYTITIDYKTVNTIRYGITTNQLIRRKKIEKIKTQL